MGRVLVRCIRASCRRSHHWLRAAGGGGKRGAEDGVEKRAIIYRSDRTEKKPDRGGEQNQKSQPRFNQLREIRHDAAAGFAAFRWRWSDLGVRRNCNGFHDTLKICETSGVGFVIPNEERDLPTEIEAFSDGADVDCNCEVLAVGACPERTKRVEWAARDDI